jgi:serine/threonine protein kinase
MRVQARTIGYEDAPLGQMPGDPSVQISEVDAADAVETVGFGATLLAGTSPPPPLGVVPPTSPVAVPAPSSRMSSTRGTVLPRRPKGSTARPGVDWEPLDTPRYETLGALGEGGMGEVSLAMDQDIERKVAVKRLRGDIASEAALLRFAEEVKVVGQLEHPGIVPIHDVGIDERGNHYLVMKYVAGETLETILEKLSQGSEPHLRRFTVEYRVQVFMKVLEAVKFAHAKGYVHRDIKPANIMVGPYGEVTLMDWGIAKKVSRGDATDPLRATLKDDVEPLPSTPASNTPSSARLVQTRAGALLGTPLYMSPEQAGGKIDSIDERSDIYTLSVMFLEMLALEHPWASRAKSMEELITLIKDAKYTKGDLGLWGVKHAAPCEYVRYAVKGLEKEPEKRFQSIAEMERGLQDILDGKIAPDCYITATKRAGHEFMQWIDRHPFGYLGVFILGILSVVATPVLLIWNALR